MSRLTDRIAWTGSEPALAGQLRLWSVTSLRGTNAGPHGDTWRQAGRPRRRPGRMKAITRICDRRARQARSQRRRRESCPSPSAAFAELPGTATSDCQ